MCRNKAADRIFPIFPFDRREICPHARFLWRLRGYPSVFPVLGGRQSGDTMKKPAEIQRIRIACYRCHLPDAAAGGHKQLARLPDAYLGQILLR